MSKITYQDKRDDFSAADANEVKASINALYDDKVDKCGTDRLMTAAEGAKLATLREHYRGAYISLVALQTAIPTGNAGDEALVDPGAGMHAVKYIWDTEDGWVSGGGTGASSFAELTGNPTDNATLSFALGAKQDSAAYTLDKILYPVMQIGDNIFNYNSPGIVRGKYLNSSNAEVAYANASISDYIPILPSTAYVCNKYFAAATYNVWYDSAKAVISNFNTTGATSPSNAAYVRFSLNINSTDDISVAHIKVESGSVSSEYSPFERRILESNLPSTAITASALKHGVNLYNYLTAVSGKYLNYTTGQLADNAGFFASDFIPVLPNTDYVLKSSYQRVWYNSKKQFISGAGTVVFDAVMTSPSTAAYFRFSDLIANLYINQVAQTSVAVPFQPYKTYLQNFYDASHKWTGKKWAGIGTSISSGTLYTQNVLGFFDFVYTNCGVSGSRMAGSGADAMWQDARVNAVPSDATLVTIESGTNDWVNNVALGALTSNNTNEFYGAFNTLITKLLTRNPFYRIVIITTPYGHWTSFNGNGNKNTGNLGPEDYAEACRLMAKKWGLPICDLQQNGGWNSLNYSSYLIDDLHPNTLGGRRFSDILIGKLMEIAPKYEGL